MQTDPTQRQITFAAFTRNVNTHIIIKKYRQSYFFFYNYNETFQNELLTQLMRV